MSRTIKPVMPGTHRYMTAKSNDDYIGERQPRVLGKREALLDQGVAVEIDLDEPFTLLDAVEMDREYEARWNGVEFAQDAVESIAWTTSTSEVGTWSPEDDAHYAQHIEGDDEDLAGTDWTAWLTTPPEQFFESVGDAYVIEGPGGRDRTSAKAGGYVRVHELAAACDVPTSGMIEFLKGAGEYVAGPLAYVAKPVADRIEAEWVGSAQMLFGTRDGSRKPIGDTLKAAIANLRNAMTRDDYSWA